jgi:hypothetical protein
MNQEIACKKHIMMFDTFCTNRKPPFGPHDKHLIDFSNIDETTKKQQCGQMMQFIMEHCIGIVDYPVSKPK